MLKDEALFTPTMAKVLESQGYFQEALQVYTHLLEQMPGHTGYQEKVAEIEQRLSEASAARDRLPELFDEWLALVSARRRLERLQKLQSDFRPRKA